MTRLLLLAVILLNLLNEFTFVFVLWVVHITDLLEIVGSLIDHHVIGCIVGTAASFGLAGEGHVLVVALGNGGVRHVAGGLCELVL